MYEHLCEVIMDDGVIISSHEVYEEIQAGADDLADWVKLREKSFVPSEESILGKFWKNTGHWLKGEKEKQCRSIRNCCS